MHDGNTVDCSWIILLDVGAGIDVTGTTNLSGALNLFNGDITINSTLPIINLTDTDNNSDFSIRNSNGEFLIYDNSNTATRFSSEILKLLLV